MHGSWFQNYINHTRASLTHKHPPFSFQPQCPWPLFPYPFLHLIQPPNLRYHLRLSFAPSLQLTIPVLSDLFFLYKHLEQLISISIRKNWILHSQPVSSMTQVYFFSWFLQQGLSALPCPNSQANLQLTAEADGYCTDSNYGVPLGTWHSISLTFGPKIPDQHYLIDFYTAAWVLLCLSNHGYQGISNSFCPIVLDQMKMIDSFLTRIIQALPSKVPLKSICLTQVHFLHLCAALSTFPNYI